MCIFFSQEDVINTQCGYDIRAKPVSYKRKLKFITETRGIEKSRTYEFLWLILPQTGLYGYMRSSVAPPWTQYSSFSMFLNSSLVKIQQLALHQHFGPCGITHAAAMQWELKSPPPPVISFGLTAWPA